MEDDQSLIDGTGDPSQYDVATGGVYAASQNPVDALDNGTINNSVTGTGTASPANTVTPPAGGSSYTPSSWLSSLAGLGSVAQNLAQTAAQINTTAQPIINGKPAVSPAAAGVPASTSPLVTVGKSSISTTMLIVGALVVAAIAYFATKKK